jgi:hypothetical protein
MSNLRSKVTKSVQRASVVVHLRIYDKEGFPVDEQNVWAALNKAFEAHPYMRIESALVCPDTDGVDCDEQK